jgi:hypothetical protein
MEQQNNFRATLILFLAMVIGPSMFVLITLLLKFMKAIPFMAVNTFSETILSAAAALLFVAYFLARYLYNKKLQQINSSNTLSNNWELYRQAMITTVALIEFVIILNVIFYMLQAHPVNLIIAIAGIFSLITFKPEKHKIATLFGIDEYTLN